MGLALTPVSVVCFDIGGTLVDSGPSFAQNIQLLARRPLLRREWDAYVNFANNSPENDLKRLSEGLGLPLDLVIEAYNSSQQFTRRLFPDVLSSLQKVWPLRCVALSNAARWLSSSDLLGAERFIEEIFYSHMIRHAKPSFEAFDYVAKALAVPPSEILMVGDSIAYDCEGAIAAGWQALLLDRSGAASNLPSVGSIKELGELRVLLDQSPARGAHEK